MRPNMQQTFNERQTLIAQRATKLLDETIVNREPWSTQIGSKSNDSRKQTAWHRVVIVVTACRDHYSIADCHYPLGPGPADNNVR